MINAVKEKIRQLSNDKKAVVGGGIFLLLLVALPVALLLVNQNQDNRQEAAGTGNETAFALDLKAPASTSTITTPPQILKGSTFDVKLHFSAKGKNVVNLRTKINYDVTKFTLNSVEAGSAFQTVNSNTTTTGSVIILADTNPTTPITGNDQLVATLKFTATNNAAQLGTGTMFLSDPTEVVQQNPGGTVTTLLTYETSPVSYTVVDILPLTTPGSVFPTGYKTPIVLTSLVSNSPRTFKSAVYPYGYTVSVVYRWGVTASTTCQNLPNTVNGPVNITGTGDTPVSPNATLATGVAFPLNSVIYSCASITYGNNLTKYGQVVQFNNGTVGGTSPSTTSILTPSTTVTKAVTVPVTVTDNPIFTITNSPAPTIQVTPGPTEAAINIAVKLPGIGSNLDEGENNNPRHTRTFNVYLFSESNVEKQMIPTTFTYANGEYTGSTIIKDIPFGVPYVVKIATDNSLLKNIGFITPESQKTSSLDATGADKRIAVGKLSTESAANTLSVEDYQAFINCYNNEPVCTAEYRAKADLNDDGKVDLKDRSILIRSFVRIQGD